MRHLSPVILRTEHIGISVADLGRSIDFYRNGLGLELVEEVDFAGPHYDKILGLQSARGRLALMKAGALQIELFQFHQPAPVGAPVRRPVSDHGISHFCIEVSDIEAFYEQLTQAGATFHCRPQLFFGSIKATYVRDLDGNVFEMIESVEGHFVEGRFVEGNTGE